MAPAPSARSRPTRDVVLATAPNLRDVGGHRTRDGGWMRTGLLYRSAALHRLAGGDAAVFADLGIRTVYDLRTASEQSAEPDRLPPGTQRVALDVLGEHVPAEPSHLVRLVDDPDAAQAELGSGRAAALWTAQYRDFVREPSVRARFGRLVRAVSDADHRPALFHCSTGKDRTGWAAAIFQSLLGVPEELVLEDYLSSGVRLEPIVRDLLTRIEARGGDGSLWRPIFETSPDYLVAALDEVGQRYGSMETYVADGLGVDRAAVEALREAFLEPG